MSETLIATIVGYHTANDPSTVLSIPITGIHAIPANGYLGDGNNAGANEMVDSRGQPLPSFTNELLINLVGRSGIYTNVIECKTMPNNQIACHIGVPANHVMFSNLDTLMSDQTIGLTHGGVKLICCPRPVITETAEGRDVDAGHTISAEADIEIHANNREKAKTIQTLMMTMSNGNGNSILGNLLNVEWNDLDDSSEDDD